MTFHGCSRSTLNSSGAKLKTVTLVIFCINSDKTALQRTTKNSGAIADIMLAAHAFKGTGCKEHPQWGRWYVDVRGDGQILLKLCGCHKWMVPKALL